MTSRTAHRSQDLVAAGPGARPPLPTVAALEALPVPERHDRLDALRGELHQLASVIAERAVGRARDQRHRYRPYGLVRSLFTRMGVVAPDPMPYDRGSISSFTELGMAFVDTLVFHLDREMAFIGEKGPQWLLTRLAALLALYRIDAGPEGRARLHDPFGFLYGGLHFGASTCVQAVEAMDRLLGCRGVVDPEEKAAVMGGSVRVVHQLASVNLADVPSLYRRLGGGAVATAWFDAGNFVVDERDGAAHRIDLRPEVLASGDPMDGARYTTRGCPARHSPSGGPGPITVMWRWTVELAATTGLLAGR